MRGLSVMRVVLVLVAALSVLVGVLLISAFSLECKQPELTPPDPKAVNMTAAAPRLAEAIHFKTISHEDSSRFDPQPFLGLHAFLEKSYPNVHRSLTREVINNYSLLYTWKGSQGRQKPILIMAHLDVVPVEPGTEEDWTHPPFSGQIAGGYVWGRGSMDDKASVLGILEALELLLLQGFQPKRTVYFAFGHDEELGGQQGAAAIAALLRSRGVEFEYIIDEGLIIGHALIPGVAAPVAMVGIAEKGRITLELSAAGAGGHASMPPRSTAIGILSTAIQKLEANPMPATIGEPVRQLFACVRPQMSFIRRLVFSNLWLFEPVVKRQLAALHTTNALVRTTAAVTMVQGGTKENMLPTEAKAVVNIRILPGDTTATVTEHVRQVIDDPRVTIHQLSGTEPSPVSDTKSLSFRTLARTIRQIFPDAVVAPSLAIGRTDSEHYLSLSDAAYRFLPLRLSPEDVGHIHGTNERITIDNYAEVIEFYVQLLRNSAS